MSREISFSRDSSPTNINNNQRFSEDIGTDSFQSYNQEMLYPPMLSFNSECRQQHPYLQQVHNPERLSPPYQLEPSDFNKQCEVNRQSKIRQPFTYYEEGRRPKEVNQSRFYDECEDQNALFHFESPNKQYGLINLDRENKLHEAKPSQYFQDTFIQGAPEMRTEIRESSLFNSDNYINQGSSVQTQNKDQNHYYQNTQQYDLSYLGSQYSPRQNQAFLSSGQYIQEDRNAGQYPEFDLVQSTNEHPNDRSDSTFNSSQKITTASSASSKQRSLHQNRPHDAANTLSQTSSSPRDINRLKPSNLTTPLENSEQNNSSMDEEITNKDSFEQSSDNNHHVDESDEIAVQTTPSSAGQPQFGRKKREKKRACKESSCQESLLFTSSKDVNEIAKELDLEMMQWVDRDSKVQEQEADLEKLKRKKIQNKKELQIQRNRITAQLSRDRKKLENDFLRGELIKMRKLVADISQSLQANRDNQKPSAFCQNCSNLLISHFNLPIEKTRVIKDQQCNDNKFEEDKINQTQASATQEKSGATAPSLLQKRKPNGGAFEFTGSSRVGMKTVAALSIFAIIAFACIAGFQSQGTVQLNNNDISVKSGRILYQQQNPLVPLKEAQAPALIRMQSTDLTEIHQAKHMSKELMKFEPDVSSTLPTISEQIVDLSALRASFIDRQTIKLLSQQKEFKIEGISFGSDNSFLIEDFNNRYIIKPIKATVPAYFDQQLATAPLFQLDDGLSAEDDENDTIVYQPQHQKQKFLNIHTIPKVNNDRSSQNNNYQLQHQRYFDRVHQQLDDELTSVYCHASDVIPSTSFDSQLLLSEAYKSHYYQTNSRNENDPSNASANSPLNLGINKFHVVIPIDQAHMFSQSGYLPDPDSSGAHPQLVEISGFVEEINYIYQKYPSTKVNL